MIRVAYAAIDALSAQCESTLSREELERADAFKAAHRRQQFVLSRALLRMLLEKHAGEPAASFRLVADGRGKPHCIGGPAISISHSRDLVVCAVTTDGDIGIDIEFADRPHDTSAIAARYFSEDETAWLGTQPKDHFYLLWVLKEAWLKATGTGIAGGLNSLQCHVTPPQIEARTKNDVPAMLSVHRLGDAFIGLATTITAHDQLISYTWDASSNGVLEDNALRFLAGNSGKPVS